MGTILYVCVCRRQPPSSPPPPPSGKNFNPSPLGCRSPQAYEGLHCASRNGVFRAGVVFLGTHAYPRATKKSPATRFLPKRRDAAKSLVPPETLTRTAACGFSGSRVRLVRFDGLSFPRARILKYNYRIPLIHPDLSPRAFRMTAESVTCSTSHARRRAPALSASRLNLFGNIESEICKRLILFWAGSAAPK